MNDQISTATLFQEFVKTKGDVLPRPGFGSTWSRFASLADTAALDLAAGRLCEGHVDALAIIGEAGQSSAGGASYGVWASKGTKTPAVATRVDGGWQLEGTKEFCSGVGLLDRALVVASTERGDLIFDIDVQDNVVDVVADSWPAIGMAKTHSETVEFGGPVIRDYFVIGTEDFYLSRPGFWFGAVGVAACWFGGAVGLVNELTGWTGEHPSDQVLADLGACVAELELMRVALQHGARSIDSDPDDVAQRARFNALTIRHLVHAAALTVLERSASAGGARPLCHDRAQSQRAADFYVYLSQHRGNAGAKELGEYLTKARTWH